MRYFVINGVPIQQETEPSSEMYSNFTEITESEYLELINPIPIEPSEFEIAKQNKQDEFNLFAYNFISNGYLDTETNYKLFTSENDILNYATLLNSLQFENDDTQIEFGTMLGWKTDTCLVVKSLLERYSRYCRPITTKILRIQTEIDNAKTLTDLENIII